MDKNVLWNKGLLGDDSPRVLQYIVFYYAGMEFYIWGFQELYYIVWHEMTAIL